jgi:hypothetical protein
MAFENCPNCDARIGCSCEYQTAKDGSTCCDACVKNYDLAMDLAQAVVDTVPTKKTTIEDEPELFGGDDLEADDEEPGVL